MSESNVTPFQFYIQTIGRGQKRRRSLTQDEARDAMRLILQGQVTDMQLGAFLMLIRVREETPEEAAGFVEAVRETFGSQPLPVSVDVDWGTYAGKRRQLPWFLLALELLVERGYRVVVHGIVGNDSSRLYTQPIAELLGWPVARSLQEAVNCLDAAHKVFIPVEAFAPQIKTLMDHRQELGLRSPVHTVARMLNPLDAKLSVHGVFHKGYDQLHQKTAEILARSMPALQNEVRHTLAFCGDAGEAEVRPDKSSDIYAVENDQAWSFSLPKTFFERDSTQKEMDPHTLQRVWRKEISHGYGEATVVQTLAMSLKVLESLSVEDSLKIAQALWASRGSKQAQTQ